MNAAERTGQVTEFRRIPVSSQGQVTLPKPIRERLGVGAGGLNRINIVIYTDGRIGIEPEPTVDEVFGILKTSAAADPAGIEELREDYVNDRLGALGYTPKNS
jgi:AbrB family looped-hinge helix DNA binding protein